MIEQVTSGATIVMAVSTKAQPSVRRTRTRARLIESATEVVAEHGFHAATVDRIAQRAGFSVGALYSNFKSKDELFFAVFDGHLVWFAQRLEAVSDSAKPTAAISDWLGALATEPEQFHVFIEFWAYAVRKPKVRRQFAKRMDQMRADVAAVIERQTQNANTEPPLSPELIALLVLAIGRGLALEKLARPGAVPDKPIAELLAGLLGT
jgi:AcrR family transcriptional regulator